MIKKYRKLAFLDRDGTIIVDKIYLSRPEDIEFAPGAIGGLRQLRDKEFGFIIITNQSGIARGYFDEERLNKIHSRLIKMLEGEGINILKIYYCPHSPNDNCSCRKPQPGMILNALAEFKIDKKNSVFIGDTEADVGAAQAAGIQYIKIMADSHGDEKEFSVAMNFLEASEKAILMFKDKC